MATNFTRNEFVERSELLVVASLFLRFSRPEPRPAASVGAWFILQAAVSTSIQYGLE